ncbi:hypothetical protein CBM2633_B70034 [Cupriavidus taiwanensis]|nr:hypothetical protein CBM2633_B70034 [Cupriavidus taiwanensis]
MRQALPAAPPRHRRGQRAGPDRCPRGAGTDLGPRGDARMTRFLVPLAAFLALAVALAAGLRHDPRELPSPLVGKAAPAFRLPLLAPEGRTLASADLRGKVWLLNVWASWCAACRTEHPVLVEFAARAPVPLYGLNYKDEAGAERRGAARGSVERSRTRRARACAVRRAALPGLPEPDPGRLQRRAGGGPAPPDPRATARRRQRRRHQGLPGAALRRLRAVPAAAAAADVAAVVRAAVAAGRCRGRHRAGALAQTRRRHPG